MRIVTLVLAIALVSPTTGAERSFGTPKMTLVKEMEMKGRTVLRYEHESVPEWGYAKKQQDYFYLLPATGKLENKPLHVVLHSAGHSGDKVLADAFAHPDWFHYVGLDDHNVLYLDCRKNKNDWWWGAHTITARGGSANGSKRKFDTEYSPTEKRVLTTVEWAITTCKADRNRVYLSGISMGGSGSLGIGMYRGDIFAAVNVAVPAGVDHIRIRVFNQNIPDPPILVNFSAWNDSWCKGQEDLIDAFRKNKYPLIFAWGPYGHNSSVAEYHPAALAFPWRSIRRNAAYPVFSQCSTDKNFPAFNNALGGDPVGQIGALFRWTNIRDQEDQFEIELRLVKETELKPVVQMPTSAQTNVSLRRLQRFKTESGKAYSWSLLQREKTLQSGKTIADTAGLLTVEKLCIGNEPVRLAIHPE
jgi:hypothetical protein